MTLCAYEVDCQDVLDLTVNRHAKRTPYRHPKGTPFVAMCAKPWMFLCSADRGRFFVPA